MPASSCIDSEVNDGTTKHHYGSRQVPGESNAAGAERHKMRRHITIVRRQLTISSAPASRLPYRAWPKPALPKWLPAPRPTPGSQALLEGRIHAARTHIKNFSNGPKAKLGSADNRGNGHGAVAAGSGITCHRAADQAQIALSCEKGIRQWQLSIPTSPR